MGKLVMKVLKTREIVKDTQGVLSWSENSDSETYNPDSGYINVNALELDFISSRQTDTSQDLTLNRPQVNIGGQEAVTINLSCNYGKDFENPTELIEGVNYLYKASKTGYIALLYWLPNSDDEIESGQVKDYKSSLFRVIHDNEWNNAKIPYSESGYTGAENDFYAVPVLVKLANCKEEASRTAFDIQIELHVIAQEE